MFQYKTLGGLCLAAGLWLTASASMAAPQPERLQSSQAMLLGSSALPPQGYVAFCERRPSDCGDDTAQVLAAAAKAQADREALFALLSPSAVSAAAVQPSALSSIQAATENPFAGATPLPAPLVSTIERSRPTLLMPGDEPATSTAAAGAVTVASAAVEGPTAQAPASVTSAPPTMTPALWAKLNSVNTKVNRAIAQSTDVVAYAQVDYWTTPLEDGRRYGDCEDYVLEKQRALVAAGVPRSALNIALVTTSWGESHAVLLVNTSDGEFVLDNLSRWVTPWREKDYQWRQRQVNGEAFKWVMVSASRPVAEPPRGALLIASAR